MRAKNKLDAYLGATWAAVAAFALVGGLLGRKEAVTVAVVASVIWCLTRMIVRGIDCVDYILRDQSDDDDDEPKQGTT